MIINSCSNDPRVFEEILKRGADVNYVDFHRRTALHHAARAGNIAAIKILL